jgi:hypothetical protein
MRIVIAIVAVVTCSSNFSAQAGSLADFDRNVDCAVAALSPQNCAAYQESISCGNKAIALAESPRGRKSPIAANNRTRIAARKNGCKVGLYLSGQRQRLSAAASVTFAVDGQSLSFGHFDPEKRRRLIGSVTQIQA